MTDDHLDLVDWNHFERSRAELGPGFIRILTYFREDGIKSVRAIEAAMHEQNSVALVIPAHTLKGESMQFGAGPLADVAETIEATARSSIETSASPTSLFPTWSACASYSTQRSTCSTRRPTHCWSAATRISERRRAPRIIRVSVESDDRA